MARSAQTQTAILGALSIMPMTGYALREQVRDTLGQFWSESFGQIYPALAELEQQGLVERNQSPGSRSSTFALTATGIVRLRELLAESPQESKPRNGLLLRLFFGAQLGPDACWDLVNGALQQAESRLAKLQIARQDLGKDPLVEGAAPYIALTLSAGEHSARATIAWAHEALAQLAEMKSKQ